MKKLRFLVLLTLLAACTPQELQNALGTLTGSGQLTSAEIGSGLKQALEFGISEGAQKLAEKDGYFKSQYKILLPAEARKVTDKLQNIPGFSDIENVILEKINRGAEDAAKKAAPIFVDAIKAMTFQDALGILMGENNAATTYLNNATYQPLYDEFSPVIIESLDKFNARQYWSDAVNTYNKIPFIEKVNPDLGDYVTGEALNGLFSMVEKKELEIRNNVNARTTDLLKKVFAKQDNK
ncbi:MAG: DUF4197 domain-containing protein [Saprospiraceae bacterium]